MKYMEMTLRTNSLLKVKAIMKPPFGRNKYFRYDNTNFYKYVVKADFICHNKIDKWLIRWFIDTYLKIIDIIEYGF